MKILKTDSIDVSNYKNQMCNLTKNKIEIIKLRNKGATIFCNHYSVYGGSLKISRKYDSYKLFISRL